MTRFLYTVAVLLLMMLNAHAEAATATFTTDQTNPDSISGTPDGAGVAVAPGDTVGLIFDTPFGVDVGDSVTIFRTLFPFTTATIGVGTYDNGVTTIFGTANIGAFGFITPLTGLAAAGCGAVGGCNFLQFTTTGGQPFVLDAIAFQNGATPTEFLAGASNPIAGAAPEPKIWMMMILAFAAVAWRLKAQRNLQPSPAMVWVRPVTVPAAL